MSLRLSTMLRLLVNKSSPDFHTRLPCAMASRYSQSTGSTTATRSSDLVLLHASDVHIATTKIDQLKQWLQYNNQRVDIVMLSGDLADMPLEKCYIATQEETDKQHRILDKMVQAFQLLASKVYYIPGNHDAITTFKTEGLTSEDSPCNVHMRQVCIAPNLHLLGIGGSVPVYKDGHHLWDGFPYRNEEEYAKDLTKLLDDGFMSESSTMTPQDAVILVTHSGPDKISTSIAHTDPYSPLYGGSSTLYEYLCKEQLQQHVVMNIHGHSHQASGLVTMGRTAILNPGPLQDGCFGIYTLRKSKMPAWEVANVSLHRLPELSLSVYFNFFVSDK